MKTKNRILLNKRRTYLVPIILIMCNLRIYAYELPDIKISQEVYLYMPYDTHKNMIDHYMSDKSFVLKGLISDEQTFSFGQIQDYMQTNSYFNHQPFEIHDEESVILGGPIGPPIAGIPVRNAHFLIVLLVIAYGIYIRFQEKSSTNK